jgi:predicted transport protein
MKMASFGTGRTYDDFKKQIPVPVLPMYETIRDYCFTLGDKVVEDIRMHRIVFGKSMTFRWFADVAPEKDSVVIKIQKDRKEPANIISVNVNQDLSSLKSLLKEAYDTIH